MLLEETRRILIPIIIAKTRGPPDLKSTTGGPEPSASDQRPLRRFAVTLQPGQTEYRITHDLQTKSVIVQTRIAGRVREGGISVLDASTVKVIFGGVLNEPMDVVIVG